jgi:5-oxoprolinase (ATP-hydrolysing) subunit A
MAVDDRGAIDLNADLGEGFPWDEPLLERVTSTSISCGAHAGDEESIRRALWAAKANGVAVGAHPGFEDREHFGRREIPYPGPSLEASLAVQLAHMNLLASAEGVTLRFVKPHGALYNQAQRDRAFARAVVSAVSKAGLALLGLPGTVLSDVAREAGVKYVTEGFIDRRYRADGSLVSRAEPDALLHDSAEIRSQLLRLVGAGIETLCVHGDNPDSLRLAALALETFQAAGVRVRSFA